MKLLVTGHEGQVVSCLKERANGHGIDVVAVGRPELNLAIPATIASAVAVNKPDVVVSAAAWTAVDQAEDEPVAAHAINALGAGQLAEAAADIGVPVIHISTDYVFSGDLDRPYREDDPTGPQGVYGATKLEGERLVAAANAQHVILRTAWVYSPFGKNFVKTMLALASNRDELTIVADQQGNPTSAYDIADGIITVARNIAGGTSPEHFGVFHLAGTGDTNWAGFARGIFEASAKRGGPVTTVRDITTAEFPTKARRPANSRLDTAKLESVHSFKARPWPVALDEVMDRLLPG